MYEPNETELLELGFVFTPQGCFYEKILDGWLSDDFVVLSKHDSWFLSFSGQNRMIKDPTKEDILSIIRLFNKVKKAPSHT